VCKTKRKIPKRNAKLQWKKQVRVMSHRRKEGRAGGRKEGGEGWEERKGGREGREGGKEGRKEGNGCRET